MKIISSLLLLSIITLPLFAQGPPPPPAPSGVPFDGGIVAFLILSLLGGAGFLSRKKN